MLQTLCVPVSALQSMGLDRRTRSARELFARKVVGSESVTDASVAIVAADGGRVGIEVSSVPVFRGEHVVGVFGQVSDVIQEPHAHPALELTPRQGQVLELLERGRSAHSRLEAVAIANGAY